MGHVITIAAEKGGVGKTATAVNIAYALAKKGLAVGVIDLDGQGHSTSYLGLARSGEELVGALDSATDAIPWQDTTWGIKVAAGGAALNGLESLLSQRRGAERRLKLALERTPDNPDIILIDCPPGFAFRVTNALVASDSLVVPVVCEDSGVDGLDNVLASLEDIKNFVGTNCVFLGVIPQLVDTRTRQTQDILEWLPEQLGEELVSPNIRRSVAVSESWGAQTPIIEYDPTGNGAIDYGAVTTWLQERIG